MKKIFLSMVATIIMSSVAVYADSGKKVKTKHIAKKEICGKNCPNTTNCHKGKCPNKPDCVCL